MEKKDVRIQLVMSATEIAALDDWRAENRIWSRSEAIRRLIKLSLEAQSKSKPKH